MDKINWTDINLKGRDKGLLKTLCPACSHTRKKKHDPCLSVDINKGLAKCHNCGATSVRDSGSLKIEPIKTYQAPSKKNMTKLNDEALKYLTEVRKIPQSVINANKLCSDKSGKGIVYPYLQGEDLVNYKIRFYEDKRFIQAKEAKPIMFNYDRIKDAKEIVINEGEDDSMSWEVAGITWHTTVNQGAPNPNDTNIDKKLECITNCYEVFEQAETIYIGVDNDANGRRLKDELVRRFGAAKCKIIDYGDCKDANEYLVKHGAFELKKLLEQAKDIKIEGIFTVDDVFDSMLDSYRNGKHRGTTTYFPEIDAAFTWRESDLNLWTGYENEGKSLFIKQLLLIKSAKEGKKHAIFTPEDMPIGDFFDDLIEMYVGKSCDPYYERNLMTEQEYIEAATFIKEHFFVIYPKADFKLESIFERVDYLIKKQGVWSMTFDPYNTVEHLQRPGEREELYISRFLAKLKRLAVENNIVVNLVAHQNTARKNQQTGLYYRPWKDNIKGGGVFSQKADNVLIVSRPNYALNKQDPTVMFASDKIKKQKLVGIPQEINDIIFNIRLHRYQINGYNPLGGAKPPAQTQEKPLPNLSPTDAFGDEVINDEIPF